MTMCKTQRADKSALGIRFLGAISILLFDIHSFAMFTPPLSNGLKPNIIVILTDDQGYADLGVYGSADLRTPNIDRMAKKGARIVNFYAQPSCGPSRAALLTGSYPILVGEPANKKNPNTILHEKELTIAEMLEKSGYITALIGKWHLAGDGEAPWDFVLPPAPPGRAGGKGPFIANLMPNGQGFSYFFGTPMHNGFTKDVDLSRFVVELMRNEEVVESPADIDRLTKTYTKEAVNFIRNNKNKPFFILLSHNMPHVPLAVSDAFRGKSPRGLYGDAIEEIDWSVGQVVSALKDLNLLKDTLVVFLSDNGPEVRAELGDDVGSAGELRGGKYSNWEGGVRVPAVFYWSGTIQPRTISEGIFSLMDIFPTAAALAGGNAPDSYGLNGVNILPALKGEDLDYRPRQSYFYYSLTSLQAVRMDNWKLVLPRAKNSPHLLWLGKYMDRVEKPMLFNLKLDASEQNDLATERPDLVAKMLLEVERGREEFGDYNRIGTSSRFFDPGPKRPKTYFLTHRQP